MPLPRQAMRGARKMSFWNISLERVNDFYAWGWRASMFGALITFFGVAFLFWGTRIRDHDFEENIGELHVKAASAEERSKVLDKETKQLTASNLVLVSDLEKERIARLDLERKYAWRTLLPAQKADITASLSGQKIEMFFEYLPVDPEATKYAEDLAGAFRALPGIRLHVHALTMPPPPIGVTVAGNRSAEMLALETALAAAKIEFAVVEAPSATFSR